MNIIIFISLFYTFIICQTTIPLDTVVSRTASSTSNDTLLFTSTFQNPSIVIELLGPGGLSIPAVTATMVPVVQLVAYTSLNTYITTSGSDINVAHASGSPCPGDINIGSQQIDVIYQGSGSVPYEIRVNVTDGSLANNHVISELACCNVPIIIPPTLRHYYIDVSASDTVLRFFVAKTNIYNAFNPVLLVKFGDCVRTLLTPDYTYQYNIAQDNTIGIFEINSASSPPLSTGRYYVGVPRNSVELNDYSYSLGACLGSGCTVDISTNPINNSGVLIIIPLLYIHLSLFLFF
jgi:hypothetical protein